jgi:hypothetical protein
LVDWHRSSPLKWFFSKLTLHGEAMPVNSF